MDKKNTFIKKNMLSYILSLAVFLSVHAQQDIEYKMEIGGALGGSFYMGDANYTHLFNRTGIASGIISRYHLNPHMTIKGNLLIGKIAGDTNDQENSYPQNLQSSFSRTIYDLGAQFEYNFFGYGTGLGYKSNNKFSPYLLAGLGLTYAPKPAKSIVTANIPIGIGLKYKLSKRINIGTEFAMHFTMSDELDVTNKTGLELNDPYLIKGSGLKNKDSYAIFTFFLTYDISPRCRDCNNNNY